METPLDWVRALIVSIFSRTSYYTQHTYPVNNPFNRLSFSRI